MHDLNNYKTFKELFRDVFKNISIDETERKQDKFWGDLDNLKKYDASISKYVELKENVLKNAKKKKIMMERKKLLRGSKIFFFHFLRKMVWKLTVVINNQILQTHLI